MLGGMVERFGVVRVGSGFEQSEGERGVVVKASCRVEARERIKSSVRIGAISKKNACSFGQVASPAGSSIGKAREANERSVSQFCGPLGPEARAGVCFRACPPRFQSPSPRAA